MHATHISKEVAMGSYGYLIFLCWPGRTFAARHVATLWNRAGNR